MLTTIQSTKTRRVFIHICYLLFYSLLFEIAGQQKQHPSRSAVFADRQFLILPGRFQPSTFSVCELNYCVRDGNRWILAAIITGLFEM